MANLIEINEKAKRVIAQIVQETTDCNNQLKVDNWTLNDGQLTVIIEHLFRRKAYQLDISAEYLRKPILIAKANIQGVVYSGVDAWREDETWEVEPLTYFVRYAHAAEQRKYVFKAVLLALMDYLQEKIDVFNLTMEVAA